MKFRLPTKTELSFGCASTATPAKPGTGAQNGGSERVNACTWHSSLAPAAYRAPKSYIPPGVEVTFGYLEVNPPRPAGRFANSRSIMLIMCFLPANCPVSLRVIAASPADGGDDLTQRVDLVARVVRPARVAAIQVRLE